MSVIVVLLLIGSVVFLFVRLRSGETLNFATTADPHRAIAALLGLLAAKRRWQTVSQSEHGAHFVYIALTRRRESLVVSVGSAGAGTFVRVASNGPRGKAVGRALRRHVAFAEALGTCVNAVSRRTPSTLQGSAYLTQERLAAAVRVAPSRGPYSSRFGTGTGLTRLTAEPTNNRGSNFATRMRSSRRSASLSELGRPRDLIIRASSLRR